MAKEFDCFKCKHRGTVPGDCHSRCCYPGLKSDLFDMFADNSKIMKKLKIKGNPHGILSGWFLWPCNFDPTWLENCEGFEKQGS